MQLPLIVRTPFIWKHGDSNASSSISLQSTLQNVVCSRLLLHVRTVSETHGAQRMRENKWPFARKLSFKFKRVRHGDLTPPRTATALDPLDQSIALTTISIGPSMELAASRPSTQDDTGSKSSTGSAV